MQFAPQVVSRAMAWAALLALVAMMAIAVLASWGGSPDSSGTTLKSPIAAKDVKGSPSRRA